jgi:hypothetical protein
MPSQSLQASFPDVFQKFRTWRVLIWISWCALFGVTAICIAFGRRFGLWPNYIIILGCFAFAVSTWAKLRYLLCPRCHKDFFRWLELYPIFLREGCWHCGLPIYRADNPPT